MPESCAVVYVASLRKYVVEALASLATLRVHMPDVAVYLIASPGLVDEAEHARFTHVVTLQGAVGSFIDKAGFLEPVRESRVLFLDGDTHVCAPLTEGFELLDRFELALAHAPWRHVAPVGDVPSAFVEFNTGVIFARNSVRVREAFRRWPTFARDGDPHDQQSFRRMVWHERLETYVLPPEWNARAVFPIFVQEPVRVLHARFPDMGAVAAQMNAEKSPRVFHPDSFASCPEDR
jgi:hypothetical protein